MSDELIVLEGVMTASESTVQDGVGDYSPGSGRAMILQGFYVTNTDSEDRYGKITVGSTPLTDEEVIPAHNTLYVGGMELPILEGENILVEGEVDSVLFFRVWGIEVDSA